MLLYKESIRKYLIKAIDLQIIISLITFIFLYAIMFGIKVTLLILAKSVIPISIGYLSMLMLIYLLPNIINFKKKPILKSIFIQFFLLVISIFLGAFAFMLQELLFGGSDYSVFRWDDYINLSISLTYVCVIFGGIQTLIIGVWLGCKIRNLQLENHQ
ncbi:hypothetical protein CAPN006_21840 [Capnocytophaga canimorsus]|nr:hypothetical protein CAPN006_21840 [Capnocytophaga canimorsus]